MFMQIHGAATSFITGVRTYKSVGSAVSTRTPDNASDLEEEAGEQQEVGSISSSLEAPQEDRMLLLDEDGASTIPDNVSDVDETGLSGRGSASLDGRESPLSQAPSQGLRDGHENEIGDLGAASTAAGSEADVAQRVLPSGVPVAVRKQNAEGLEEKFGKFTVPTSQQSRRDDQRSLLSDSWSTNVVPSDDEGPALPHLPPVDVAELGILRGRAVNRTGSLCGAGTATEDRSDTWSLDAIASDSEADGGRERTRQVLFSLCRVHFLFMFFPTSQYHSEIQLLQLAPYSSLFVEHPRNDVARLVVSRQYWAWAFSKRNHCSTGEKEKDAVYWIPNILWRTRR
ncbi:hypothetical protein Y032_0491g2398 [Ancylostoma ceylanicum]|uniref:Uncharacterized protein n=2 Tax=Ancylostoma ceylanicum TaxID=53326 RepID=A0A016WWX0_9BILA|nr:hypothetical protein Y032_0491g2398 [Ancylostoma ceylanicum]